MERKKFSKNLHVKPTFRHRFKSFILFIQLRKNNNKTAYHVKSFNRSRNLCFSFLALELLRGQITQIILCFFFFIKSISPHLLFERVHVEFIYS